MYCMTEKQIDEEKLWELYAATKDINIRNQIIEKYSYLVKIIAIKIRGIYQQYGDIEDVINEGIIALIDVINKYDITKNIKFETYATIRIKGAIIDYVRKQDWTPRKVKNDIKIINEAEKHLFIKLGREPNDQEIANYLNIDIDKYNQIIKNSHKKSVLSFEELVGDAKLKEIKNNSGYELPEEAYETKELYMLLKESIKKLNEKEILIISLYYEQELKLKDIANILNISNSRASQIHSIALDKLAMSLKTYYKNI